MIKKLIMRIKISSSLRSVLLVTFAVCCWVSVVNADTTTIRFIFPVPSPSNVTIAVGDSVTWTGASGSHPLEQVTGVNSDTPVSGGFSSTSSSFTQQFNTAGTFYYRCTNHGVAALNGQMRGSIVVQDSPSSAPTATPTETPQEGCDSKPTKAVLTSPTNGTKTKKTRVSLDWDDVTCATKYKIVVQKDKKSGTVVDQKTVSKSSYKTIALSKKHTYFWTVQSCNTKGCVKSAAYKFAIQ